jgi:sugar phosphate isomerase/epimerase
MTLQWGYNIQALKEINKYANDKDVTLCLENIFTDNSVDKTFTDLLEIQQAVGNSLKFTLDIGHARLFTDDGAEHGIKLLGENIHHIHFTDNMGVKDDHLPIGDGNSDYSGIMDFIRNFTSIVTLEIVEISSSPAAILKSRDYFKKLL